MKNAPIEDKKWQAESDLGTLIAYHKLMQDKRRYKAAMDMKKQKIKDLEEVESGSGEKSE